MRYLEQINTGKDRIQKWGVFENIVKFKPSTALYNINSISYSPDNFIMALIILLPANCVSISVLVPGAKLAGANGQSNKCTKSGTAYPADFKTIVSTRDDHNQS